MKKLQGIINEGYKEAEFIHEVWMDHNKYNDEVESYPLDENGFPQVDAFCNMINERLWEIHFEYFEEDRNHRRSLKKWGTDAVGFAFFDGVHKYINEHFHK